MIHTLKGKSMTSTKKTLTSLAFVIVGILSCTSCAKKMPPSAPAPAPPPVSTVASVPTITPVPPPPPAENGAPPSVQPGPVEALPVSAENVSFTLPNAGEWKQMQVAAPEIKALYRNNSKHILVLLAKDDYAKNTQALSLLTMNGMKKAGGTITAVKQVVVNNNKMVMIVSSKGPLTVSTWIMSSGGSAYNLSCGRLSEEVESLSICKEIGASLKITL